MPVLLQAHSLPVPAILRLAEIQPSPEVYLQAVRAISASLEMPVSQAVLSSGGSGNMTIGGNFTLNGTAFTSTSGILEIDGNAAFTSCHIYT